MYCVFMSVIATNKRAYHNYHILEKYEAGVVLVGSEVKSLRAGKIILKDSFARLVDGELFLFNCYISPFKEQNTHFPPAPERDRKLLLHRRELNQINKKITMKGYTAVPLRVYFKNQRVKVEIGIGQAKKMHDKRHDLKEKQSKREMDRGMKSMPGRR